MNLETRIDAFTRLGRRMEEAIAPALGQVSETNPWFSPTEIRRATVRLSAMLIPDNLYRWVQPYLPLEPAHSADVLVISAGNIPMVGFHDFLSVLISGNTYTGKLSTKDNLLIPLLADELIRIEPQFSEYIRFTDQYPTPDAAIATGGNNTSLYFNRKYRNIPSIIRKNRTSVAILDGTETRQEHIRLAADILEFYGLGCRSISHVFLPVNTPVDRLADSLRRFTGISPNHMYSDNLVYQTACLKLAGHGFKDTRNVLIIENSAIFSPIGTLHYSHYSRLENLISFLDSQAGNIQCIVGHQYTPFGLAQKPDLWDYADHIDTLSFLKSLKP
ncbi:MAG: hypothetical protein A2X22_11355 [Bacteroidetes bacterium GWF2_49_14]|nr:MAG: hypothetical protein A2X22_11355 [Bacteroidetes bacterium GWF2_49_14]